LQRFARRGRPFSVRVLDAGQEQPLELPAGAVSLLMDILEAKAAAISKTGAQLQRAKLPGWP
jgi:hypothetical protein